MDLGAVLETLRAAQLPGGERKALQRHAVAVAMLGGEAVRAPAAPAPAAEQGAIAAMEEALTIVGKAMHTERKPRLAEAKAWLRQGAVAGSRRG